MDKYIFNDKVAVLYSPGFGAGWYTWNQEFPELIFSPAIVKLVAEEKFDELFGNLLTPFIITSNIFMPLEVGNRQQILINGKEEQKNSEIIDNEMNDFGNHKMDDFDD